MHELLGCDQCNLDFGLDLYIISFDSTIKHVFQSMQVCDVCFMESFQGNMLLNSYFMTDK